ncbi:hypothetical protein [Francisella tularensis]|nr:hypothetical protein [Francisella tularensis]
MNKYIANTVVMVEPKYFCFNQETSVNNAFQNQLGSVHRNSFSL